MKVSPPQKTLGMSSDINAKSFFEDELEMPLQLIQIKHLPVCPP
jgi:hypothetical protein